MRANEILAESAEQLDEAPVGAFSRLFTNIGAKMGLSGQQIQKQFNDEMIQIRKELGPLMRQADGVNADDFVDFMESKGLGSAARDAISKVIKGRGKNARTRQLDAKTIDGLIKNTISRAYLKQGGGRFSRYGSEEDNAGEFKSSRANQAPEFKSSSANKAPDFKSSRSGSQSGQSEKEKKMKEFIDFFRAMSPEEKEQFRKMRNS